MGLKETKKSIDHIHRQMRKAATMDEQFSLQEELQKLERQKKRQRQELEDTEDEITRQREEYVAKLRRRLTRNQSIVTQFIIRWEIH
jgi:predicted  nucleic acid-binding Zn-ribbon protein